MALASEDLVEAALGRALTSSEDVSTLLESASDRVVGYLRYTPDPVPDPVARVVAEMVAAVLLKPAVNSADYGANGYNVQRETLTAKVGVDTSTSIGPWLTSQQKLALNPYRTASSRAAFGINTDPSTETPPALGVEDE